MNALARISKNPTATDPLRPPASVKPLTESQPVNQETEPAYRYSAVFEETPAQSKRPIKWRWVWNQVLLLIEVLALVGFIFVIAQLTTTVRSINEDSKAAQEQPTAVPTPIIGVFILPGGHTPPDAFKQSEPEPVPVHLRDQVVSITPLPVPTPGPEQAQRIVIPAISVDAPVVEGDDWESLKYGAGHMIGSANPGERGN